MIFRSSAISIRAIQNKADFLRSGRHRLGRALRGRGGRGRGENALLRRRGGLPRRSSPIAPCRWWPPAGRRPDTLRAALEMFAEVVQSGARGATIGRNVWGFEQIGAAVQAFKAVIHDGKTADEALQQAGLAAMVGGKR